MEFLPEIGTPLDELDTPCLILDLDAFDRNVKVVHSYFAERDIKIRPHIKSHKCPAMAHAQLAAGATVGGVAAAKLAEAEVMIEGGIRDVFMTTEVVGVPKIRRLMRLARDAKILVCVDDPVNVKDLSEAAQVAKVQLGVLVDVDVEVGRSGVKPGQPAVDLALEVAKAPNLRFAGLMGYDAAPMADFEERKLTSRHRIQLALDSREMVEKAGLPVEILSTACTHTWNVAGEMPGVTEVQPGRYGFSEMDLDGPAIFDIHAKVMTSVISRPNPDVATIDCGHKAIGFSHGMPQVEHPSGATLTRLDSEHGRLELEGDAAPGCAPMTKSF